LHHIRTVFRQPIGYIIDLYGIHDDLISYKDEWWVYSNLSTNN
jgi:hypothetical protein